MLKRFLLKALNRFLGNYIEDINKQQLELGVFRGDISINNIKLKSNVILQLFNGKVVYNKIDSLKVNIPWKSFNRKPMQIYVKGVNIVVSRGGFCMCFRSNECEECVSHKKFLFMNKIDKVNLMLEALKEGKDEKESFLDDIVKNLGFELNVEDVKIVYVDISSVTLNISKIIFKGNEERGKSIEIKEIKLMFNREYNNKELKSDVILYPVDFSGDIKFNGEESDVLGNLNFYSEKVFGKVSFRTIQDLHRLLENYSKDRIKNTLFTKYSQYKNILVSMEEIRKVRSDEDVKKLWIMIIELQRSIIIGNNVRMKEIPNILKSFNIYKNLLVKSKSTNLNALELNEVHLYEEREPLIRIFNINKNYISSLNKRGWTDIFSFSKNSKSENLVRKHIKIPIVFKFDVIELAYSHGDVVYDVIAYDLAVKVKDMLSSMNSLISIGGVNFCRQSKDMNDKLVVIKNFKGGLIKTTTKCKVKGEVRNMSILDYEKIFDALSIVESFRGMRRIPVITTEYKTLQKYKMDISIPTFNANLELCNFGIKPKLAGKNIKLAVVSNRDNDIITFVGSFKAVDENNYFLTNEIEFSCIYQKHTFYCKVTDIHINAKDVEINTGKIMPSNSAGIVVPFNVEVLVDGINIENFPIFKEHKLNVKRLKIVGRNEIKVSTESIVFLNHRNLKVFKVLKLLFFYDCLKKTTVINKLKLFVEINKLKKCIKLIYSKEVNDITNNTIVTTNNSDNNTIVTTNNSDDNTIVTTNSSDNNTIVTTNSSDNNTIVTTNNVKGNLSIKKLNVLFRDKQISYKVKLQNFTNDNIGYLNILFNENLVEMSNVFIKDEIVEIGKSRLVLNKNCKEVLIFLDSTIKKFDFMQGKSESRHKFQLSDVRIELWNGAVASAKCLEAEQNEGIFFNEFNILIFDIEQIEHVFTTVVFKTLCFKNGKITAKGNLEARLENDFFLKVEDVLSILDFKPQQNILKDHCFTFNAFFSVDAHGNEVNFLIRDTMLNYEDTVLTVSSFSGCYTNNKVVFCIEKIVNSIDLYYLYAFVDFFQESFNKKSEYKNKIEIFGEIKQMILSFNGDGINIADIVLTKDSFYAFIDLVKEKSEIKYKIFKTKKKSIPVLSIIGGVYSFYNIMKLSTYFNNEYDKICNTFNIKPSNEPINILLLEIKVDVSPGVNEEPNFILSFPIFHINIYNITGMSCRLMWFMDVYNRKIMDFEKCIEETITKVERGGILSHITIVNELKGIISSNFIKEVNEFIYKIKQNTSCNLNNKAPNIRRKNLITVKNMTAVLVGVITKNNTVILDNKESGIEVEYNEQKILLDLDGFKFNLCLLKENKYPLEVNNQLFIVSLNIEKNTRRIEIWLSLNIVNLCNLDLTLKLHRLNTVTKEINIGKFEELGYPLRYPFTLELGYNGLFKTVGTVSMENVFKTSVKMYILTFNDISVCLDINTLPVGSKSMTILIFYPMLEIISAIPQTALVSIINGSNGFKPQSLIEGEKNYVYLNDLSSELSIYNHKIKKSVKLFNSYEQFPITTDSYATITKEGCYYRGFTNRFILSKALSIKLIPQMVVKNELNIDVFINSTRYIAGISSSHDINSLKAISIDEYLSEENIELYKTPFSKVIKLNRYTYGINNHTTTINVASNTFTTKEFEYLNIYLKYTNINNIKELEIKPAYLIINKTGTNFIITNKICGFYLTPQATMMLHFFNFGFYILTELTGNINCISKYIPHTISFKNFFSFGEKLYSIDIKTEDKQKILIIQNETIWPYIIHNLTPVDILFNQDGSNYKHFIKFKSSFNYALDDITLKPLLYLFIYDKQIVVNLDADGLVTTQNLVISINQTNEGKIIEILDNSNELNCNEFMKQINLFINKSTISILDEGNKELVCGSIKGIELMLQEKNSIFEILKNRTASDFEKGVKKLYNHIIKKTDDLLNTVEYSPNNCSYSKELQYKYTEYFINFKIESIQIDNQSIICKYPVILYPKNKYLQYVEENSKKEKFLIFDLALSFPAHYIYINELFFEAKPCFLNIEEKLLMNLLILFLPTNSSEFVGKNNKKIDLESKDKIICRTMGNIPQGNIDLYYYKSVDYESQLNVIKIDNLTINKIRTNINFYKNIDTEFTIIGFLINNVSDFSLEIDGLKILNLLTNTTDFVDKVQRFYISQSKKNMYKVFTHLDFIGNIGNFTEALSKGFKGLLNKSPSSKTRSGKYSLYKGSKSLFKNTIYGLSNTIGKVSKSISASANLATFDENFKKNYKRFGFLNDDVLLIPGNNIKDYQISVFSSTSNFIEAVTSGIAGLAVKPIEGTNYGISGLLAGIGKGFFGAIAKPIVGAADLVTDISDVIKMSVDEKIVRRINYPRITSYKIDSYDTGDSQGSYIFNSFIQKKENELYLKGSFGYFNGFCQLILTTERILASNTVNICEINTNDMHVTEQGFIIEENEVIIENIDFIRILKELHK